MTRLRHLLPSRRPCNPAGNWPAMPLHGRPLFFAAQTRRCVPAGCSFRCSGAAVPEHRQCGRQVRHRHPQSQVAM